MSRRSTLAVGGAGLVVVLALGAWAVAGRSERTAAADSPASKAPAATATVARKDLAETKNVAGTLGYGAAHDVSLNRMGTVTGLPPVGTIVEQGGSLLEVDGLPVPLLLGDRPMWRTLQEGVSDGPDVAQLEANLIDLGYGTAGNLGPNDVWSQATTAAVERWQKASGLPETGVVAPGDLAYEPAPVRVSAHAGRVGGQAGGPVLKVTGPTKVVEVALDADLQALVVAGQPVRVELPDGAVTPGTITSVGSVATAGQQGQEPTVAVAITLDDQGAGDGLDQAPVSVRLTTSKADGVLAVPVSALLALAEGGYAVEEVTGAGTTRLVAVRPGAFAGGWVAVTGDLAEGDQVVVPR